MPVTTIIIILFNMPHAYPQYILTISRLTQKVLMIIYSMFEKCSNTFEKRFCKPNSIIVSKDGISMDQTKYQKVLDWPKTKIVKKPFKVFWGFANFYQKFIKIYSKTIVDITSLLRKDAPFTNTSGYAVSGVISKYSSSNLLHPVAFKSKNLHSSELNYDFHNKEPLAIVFCLQKWCSYLLSLAEPFEVLTDNNALKYLRALNFLLAGKLNGLNFYLNFMLLSLIDPPLPKITLIILNLMTLHSNTLELQDSQLSDTYYSISQNDFLLYKQKIVT
ncbi:uncharacterized protein VP01_1639g14 [Puccinia sorghi]|uniref:Reverse transcriptase RNase H-like domain-containing protein n=1 Tax=Puccinia sorghi TaxID=27349 RepID=A0A0L6VHB8_9BASI|nr:uncharacterized protein VP01_1639g14 [Puccinia sorghi]